MFTSGFYKSTARLKQIVGESKMDKKKISDMYIKLSEASEFKGFSGSNIKTEKHRVVRKWPQIWDANFLLAHCHL